MPRRAPAESTVVRLTGAAPSAAVCWVVGPAGTVLLTTDGRTWRRIEFPDRADLAGVAAADASNATITTADGRVFRTRDGGRSWLLQETPAAPF